MEMVYLGLLAPGTFSGLQDKQAASLCEKYCPPLHTLKQSHSLGGLLSPQCGGGLVSQPWSTLLRPHGLQYTGFPVLHCLPEFAQTRVHWVNDANHLILCHPLLLMLSVFPSISVFSNESALHIRWPKYWRFNFSISPSNEYSVLISFRIDWFALLAVQGTLKSLLQQCKSKAAILWHSTFFMVQLSHHIWLLEKS